MSASLAIKIAGSLLGLVLLISLCAACYHKGYSNAINKVKAEQLDAVSASIATQNAKNSVNQEKAIAYSKKKEAYDEKQKQNSLAVQRSVLTVPIYSQCIIPDDGVRLINSAISAANSLISSS